MVGVLSHLSQVRTRLAWVLGLGVIAWIVMAPNAFLSLWLTPDQQGRLWFQLGDYDRAARVFEDPRWKGFSLYAGEDFETAERYFSQYQDAESLLAQANALAHQGDYNTALQAYKDMAKRHPTHPAPAVNVPLMQALIEASEGMMEDQRDGSEDSKGKPGRGEESSDGSGQDGAGELDQYSADQLLQDPDLTEMWLRQIQRDPAEFLTTKFYLQLEQNEEEEP